MRALLGIRRYVRLLQTLMCMLWAFVPYGREVTLSQSLHLQKHVVGLGRGGGGGWSMGV